MKRIILIGSIAVMALLHASEPSVYGAGDIDSSSPYGLTQTEKVVLENRKTVQNLKNRVAEQQNRIDGLTTIIDGLNKELLSVKEQLIANEKADTHESDYNRTYSLLLELGKMVDDINNNYVTREDLKEALAGSRAVEDTTVSSFGGNSADLSTIYREGVKLFAKKSYESAKEHFTHTASENYKPASSNYYLGEIAYYTKDYDSAIIYYKKSASLYDSASYMKTLYLHTALSLARTGQKSQARDFFQFVVDNYPNTKASKIARKNL
jgi:TolA-binding protein